MALQNIPPKVQEEGERSNAGFELDQNHLEIEADVDWSGPRALIDSAESTGLLPDEIAAADEAVRIPMQGSVESLNVAVAAGIILYEANRQRTNGEWKMEGY